MYGRMSERQPHNSFAVTYIGRKGEVISMVTFAVVGGDVRQLRLAEMLRQDGNRVNIAAFEKEQEYKDKCMDYKNAVRVSDCVILPAPSFTTDGHLVTQCSDERISSKELLECLEPGMLVVGGRLGEGFESKAAERGCRTSDILAREDFNIANAVPTAEGAIQIAMEQLPVTIAGSTCLVVGAGRIGKQLAMRLHLLGADVTVTVRKAADAAFCESFGVKTEDTARLKYLVHGSDIIFNTVPEMIFDEQVLGQVEKSCPCIDLASLPGGFDEAAAEKLGIKPIHALSLPGKVAPVTSAGNLKKVIERILTESAELCH